MICFISLINNFLSYFVNWMKNLIAKLYLQKSLKNQEGFHYISGFDYMLCHLNNYIRIKGFILLLNCFWNQAIQHHTNVLNSSKNDNKIPKSSTKFNSNEGSLDFSTSLYISILKSIQDFNFRFSSRNRVEVWPLISNKSQTNLKQTKKYKLEPIFD